MYCEKCGYKIETGSYCPNCGNKIEKVISEEEDKEIMTTLKPKYIVGYNILSNPLTLSVIVYFSLGSSSRFIFKDMDTTNIFYSAIFLLIIVIGNEIVRYFSYKKIEYNFYKNKLEYRDGFINIEEKEIKYSAVREVVMSQNIIERLFGLGTIRIYTSASNGTSSANGIMIHALPNLKENYNNIKKIIDIK